VTQEDYVVKRLIILRSKNFVARFVHIRTKMIASFTLVIVASLIFIIYFSVSTYGKKIESNHIKYSSQVIENLIGNINNYIDELEVITNSLNYNYYIQSYLIERSKPNKDLSSSQESAKNYQASLEALSNIINLRGDITSIFIVDTKEISIFKSQTMDVKTTNFFIDPKWFSELPDDAQTMFFIGQNRIMYKDLPANVFSFARQIERYDGGGNLGVILIDTNLSIIQRFFNSASLDENSFILMLDATGELIESSTIPPAISSQPSFSINAYGRDIVTTINQSTSNTPLSQNSFIQTVNEKDYLVSFDTIESTQWILATITDYQGIINDANTVRNYIVLVGFITLILLILITYIISSKITTPIASLKNTMNLIHKGDLSHTADISSNDEVGELATSFNYMIQRINTLMHEVVEEQAEKRKSELRVLQDQINPHFLYNTLDSIIWMAESKDPNTVPMIEALSNLFRISLNRGQEMITIQEELEHVKNYLYILSMRYYERFDYSFDIDPNTLKYKIPKLLLQPLVENAIYHGIKSKSTKGLIVIRTCFTQENLVLTVIDDGVGMTPTKVMHLLNDNAPIESEEGSGIGVTNVHQRIKLYFGPSYGITIQSIESVGTTVNINLPL
jgi:two-component system, sensor histidine kinase YesM